MPVELDETQTRAMRKALAHKRVIVWHRQGEGKTRIAVGLFALMQKVLRSKRNPLMVVVTRKPAFYGWAIEVEEKCGLQWCVREYNGGKNWSVSRPTILLVSHGILAKAFEILQTFPIDLLVYDELYLYSNPRSQRSVAAGRLSDCFDRVVGLSGTVLPNTDNLAIYGQAHAVGLAPLLARSVTAYRSKYQVYSKVRMGSKSVPQFSNRAGWRDEVFGKLGDHVDVHFPKEPRRIEHDIKRVELTARQKQLIKQLKSEFYAEIEEAGFTLDTKMATEIAIRSSQIANGWVANKQGDTVEFPSPKAELLLACLEDDVAAGHRVLVWCGFRHDLEYLARRWSGKALFLRGGDVFDVRAWELGKYPVVFATMASGASVNHFAQVQTAYYFSYGNRWLDYDQSVRRTNRKDSKHDTCRYLHFHADGSLDRHNYDSLTLKGREEKQFISKGAVLQWLRERD